MCQTCNERVKTRRTLLSKVTLCKQAARRKPLAVRPTRSPRVPDLFEQTLCVRCNMEPRNVDQTTQEKNLLKT